MEQTSATESYYMTPWFVRVRRELSAQFVLEELRNETK